MKGIQKGRYTKEFREEAVKLVMLMCRVSEVSASGYYAYISRPPSKRAKEEARLEVEIRAAHKRTCETFGAERLQHDLAAHGVKVGVCRIKRLRKKLGINCKQNKEVQGNDRLKT